MLNVTVIKKMKDSTCVSCMISVHSRR